MFDMLHALPTNTLPSLHILADRPECLILLVLLAPILLAVALVYLRSSITLIHAPQTTLISVPTKRSHSQSHLPKYHQVPLIDLIKQQCPSLTKAFMPTWFLMNGHLQTIYAGMAARVSGREFSYDRELLNLPDGGLVAIDWTSPDSVTKETPILILLHGLGGGSYDKYILDFIPPALERGFRIAALNSRGCGGIAVHTPQLYSGSFTDDVRLMIDRIHVQFPRAPLIGIGFSLGANLMMKCVGEDADRTKLCASVSVANPFDLHVSQTFLHTTLLGRELYSRVMTNGLKEFFAKHKQAFVNTTRVNPKQIDVISATQVENSTYLCEFDDAITRRMFGFRNVFEYYRMASCVEYSLFCALAQYVPDIQIPTLFLSDYNDPIAGKESIPVFDVQGNPNIVLAVTRRGGHLGWFEGVWSPRRWYPKPVLEFAEMICKARADLPINTKLSEHKMAKKAHIHYSPKHFGTVFPPSRTHHHHHTSPAPPESQHQQVNSIQEQSPPAETIPAKAQEIASIPQSPKNPVAAGTPTRASASIVSQVVWFWKAFQLDSKGLEPRVAKWLVGVLAVIAALVVRRRGGSGVFGKRIANLK
ncbi:hypothetical protein HDU98_011770 [Podochytrium sp. JEL0797]|nr:hypothetical protein HDU98_011770 [Podochytrium sp. JEL0797]